MRLVTWQATCAAPHRQASRPAADGSEVGASVLAGRAQPIDAAAQTVRLRHSAAAAAAPDNTAPAPAASTTAATITTMAATTTTNATCAAAASTAAASLTDFAQAWHQGLTNLPCSSLT